jgi:hypothetical protein
MASMRIYLPLTAQDRPVLQAGGGVVELGVGRAAWAVTGEVRAEHPGEDEEDLEYEALQDAVHVAFAAAESSARVLVLAADVPDRAVAPATEDGGAFGVTLTQACSAPLASVHVTEQDAAAAEADDTDPALLWFDTTEGQDALAFLDGATA